MSTSDDERARLAVTVREARERSQALHEERGAAHVALREAGAHHESLVTACRHADEEVDNAVGDLRRAIEREVWAATGGG